MRGRSLFAQTIAANLILVVAALTAMLLVTSDSVTGQTLFVLGLAIALSAVVNAWLLQRRFIPLEELIAEMERVNLSGTGTALSHHTDGEAESAEVARLEVAFRRMLERLETERRRSGRLAVQAQERERARVARDLHDEVNQALTGILLHLEAARSKATPELREELEATRSFADRAMEELLRLARQLRPTALDDLGLTAAIAGHVKDLDKSSDLVARFNADGDFTDLPDEVQLVVYRVAQEALSNAVQHGEAGSVEVSLRRDGNGVALEVADDGRGFAFAEADAGLGLAGMRERALLVGGELEVRSGQGGGTSIGLRVPVGSN